MTADRISSIVFILVGLAFWAQTDGLQYNGYIFPRFLVLFLILFSAIMFAQSFLKKGAEKEEGARDNLKYILIVMLLVGCWVFLLDVLGFVVSSVIFLSTMTLILDLQRLTISRVVSSVMAYIAVVLFFWIAFHKLLLVPLPTGYLI